MYMLHRYGADAYLSLGNKKAIDIIVLKNNSYFTIDVKGLSKENAFILGKYESKINDKKHYYAFVLLKSKENDVPDLPDVYIVPAKDLIVKQTKLNGETLIEKNKLNNVYLSSLEKLDKKYKDKWKVFVGKS